MKSIQIRETPTEIYNAIANTARREHRSISQQALAFLARGMNASLSRKAQRKEAINSYLPIKVSKTKFDAVAAIREDRER